MLPKQTPDAGEPARSLCRRLKLPVMAAFHMTALAIETNVQNNDGLIALSNSVAKKSLPHPNDSQKAPFSMIFYKRDFLIRGLDNFLTRFRRRGTGAEAPMNTSASGEKSRLIGP